MREKPTDDIGYVRELLRDALWHIAYHEHELPKAEIQLGFARALIRTAGIDPDGERGEDETEDGELLPKSVSEYVLDIYDNADNAVSHHEDALAEACRSLGFVKALLLRGAYTEIDIKDVQAEVNKSAAKWITKKKKKKA